jgi:hypothetical protein
VKRVVVAASPSTSLIKRRSRVESLTNQSRKWWVFKNADEKRSPTIL